MRGLPEDWRLVGSPEDVHDLRAHGMLRLLAEQACDEALSWDEAPDYAVDGAG
jgi:hypothetical protein